MNNHQGVGDNGAFVLPQTPTEERLRGASVFSFPAARVVPLPTENVVSPSRKPTRERLVIAALVLFIVIGAILLGTNGFEQRGQHRLGESLNGSPSGEISAMDLVALCPPGASSFQLGNVPDDIVQRRSDFAAMVMSAGVEADLSPYSCSDHNLAVLWMAANPPPHMNSHTLISRYALAVFYFSLHGWEWKKDNNWLSDEDECTWEGITCSEGVVTGISLTHNNLHGSLPEVIGLLTSLEVVNVSMNSISGTLPQAVATLPHLVRLEVSLNDFSGIVPSGIWEQSQLKILDLANFGGTVESIPSEIGNFANLEQLLAPHTNMQGSIPSELGRCLSLRFLDLSKNSMVNSIPAELGLLHVLQTLYLSGNTFDHDSVPDEVCSLLESGKLIAFDMKSMCSQNL